MLSLHRCPRVRRASLAAVAVALTVALAGCGGSGSSPAAPAASTAAAASSVSASEFCRLAKVQLQNDAATLISGGTPAEWKAFFAKTRQQNEALAAAAPPEIKAAVVTVRGVSLKLEALMEKAGYDISKVDPAQLKTINTTETAAAGKQLQDYVTKSCGT